LRTKKELLPVCRKKLRANSRNVCVFAEGEVDRSPTGTGVSARLAIEYSRGHLREGEDFVVESIIGTRFSGQVAGKVKFGQYDAIIPCITGRAWITGRHEFLIYPDDPLREGFLLR
jgi:proline racemase